MNFCFSFCLLKDKWSFATYCIPWLKKTWFDIFICNNLYAFVQRCASSSKFFICSLGHSDDLCKSPWLSHHLWHMHDMSRCNSCCWCFASVLVLLKYWIRVPISTYHVMRCAYLFFTLLFFWQPLWCGPRVWTKHLNKKAQSQIFLVHETVFAIKITVFLRSRINHRPCSTASNHQCDSGSNHDDIGCADRLTTWRNRCHCNLQHHSPVTDNPSRLLLLQAKVSKASSEVFFVSGFAACALLLSKNLNDFRWLLKFY